jgi:probable HAF family extracellular repeat protein
MAWRPRRRLFIRVYLLLIAALVLTQTAAVPTQAPPPSIYSVQPFGPAATPSQAEDISELGNPIVGHVGGAGAKVAAVWSYDGFRQLGTLGGAQSSAFAAFYSTIVGQAETTSPGVFHAFRADSYANGAPLVDLGTLGGSSSAAYAIGYSSIVGSSQVAGNARWQAVIWTNDVITALPVSSAGNSSATDMVDDQIVGYTCASGNTSCRGFWIKEGTVTPLPTLGGDTKPAAINGAEQIVGTSALATGAKRAFLYQQGAIVNLQTLSGGAYSEALDINDAGDVVGVSDTASAGPHAFVYRNGAMIDLNTLLPSGSGWVLLRATGISAGGQIVGVGTFNGVTRGFLLTPPVDVEILPGGQRSQKDSNLPRGVEVGKTIRWVNTVWATPYPLAVYGVKITATLTGPAEYAGPVRSYDTDASECQVSAKTITCDVPGIDTVTFGREYWFTARTTGPGEIRHTVTAVSELPDPNPANNSLTERNYAVALADFALTPSTVAGGKASSARVTLTGLPPSGDAVVRLSSSRPDVAPVPATIIVPAHNASSSRAFNIIPAVVAQPTNVDITATYGLVTITKTLTVVPPALTQLYLTPTTVVGGCGTSAGKVVLSGSAPSGGAVVSLTDTNSAATAPPTVTVPAGASSQTFTIPTARVTTSVSGTVTASYGGVSKTLTLTVRPLRVKTLTVSPNPATGGTTATAALVLECAAPAGGVVVSLSSSNSAVAAPAVSSITIPAGGTAGSFSVRTSRVTASTPVNIYATVYGVRKAQSLIVNP